LGERASGEGSLGAGIAESVLGSGAKISTTAWLAKRHGVRNTRKMYVWRCTQPIVGYVVGTIEADWMYRRRYLTYYIPFFQWITQYKRSYLRGDLIAALTMASFYLPMSLSYASNLGHIPPINGLYSFVFNPLIYAFLGSCPQMVVGPEAAGSLLVGSVVRSSVERGDAGDDDDAVNARIAGVVTGMAGSIILIAGLSRLGFLDNVLSRPFLRGFISAIGIVIMVDQLIPEMGLVHQAKVVGGVTHGSSSEKLWFLFQNMGHAHGLTCVVAFSSFAIIMVCRYGPTEIVVRKFDPGMLMIL
jgi:MFS superfamily sulfate permease-like transporter